jgi:threonine 3-dehydrogenase
MFHGGKVALLGLLPDSTRIDWDDIIFKGLKVKGIYGREMYETWYKMEQMLRSGLDISKVLTHKLSVDEYEKAFNIMEAGECGKIVLEW